MAVSPLVRAVPKRANAVAIDRHYGRWRGRTLRNGGTALVKGGVEATKPVCSAPARPALLAAWSAAPQMAAGRGTEPDHQARRARQMPPTPAHAVHATALGAIQQRLLHCCSVALRQRASARLRSLTLSHGTTSGSRLVRCRSARALRRSAAGSVLVSPDDVHLRCPYSSPSRQRSGSRSNTRLLK